MSLGVKGLIKVKSCNALLLMLLVCISICLKSVLRYNYLSLDICIPGTIYIYIYIYIYVTEGVRIRCYFSKPKGVHERKRLRNTVSAMSGFYSL